MTGKTKWVLMIELFLSNIDSARAARTFEMLAFHDTSKWVLTGGFAVELHLALCNGGPISRGLNDIDFVVERFDDIPETLSSDLIFRHIHPHDSENKTLLQAVFPDTAVRVDVFRAKAGILRRSISVQIAGRRQRLISIEDLVARSARLSLTLAENHQMPAKHAHDFLRLLPYAVEDKVENAWADHRKTRHPVTFCEAAQLLKVLIPGRADLQVVPAYSHNSESKCERCEPTTSFSLADAEILDSLLRFR